MKEIQLTQNKSTIVDDEDYEFLMQWKWGYNFGYAYRIEGKKTIRMHRVVNNTPAGLDTDHIDGDKLHNCRINLRSCSRRNNLRNSKPRTDGSSNFKGVGWHKKANKWRARIHVSDKELNLGVFVCEKAAAVAYNKAATEHYGEYARLNEVEV